MRRKRSGSTFHGDLRIILHVELRSHRAKDFLQLIGCEDRGRPSAQVDRVHLSPDLSANFFREARSVFNVTTYAAHVALEHSTRKDVGGEVAITALSSAERNGNVDAQGNAFIIQLKPFPSSRRPRPSI